MLIYFFLIKAVLGIAKIAIRHSFECGNVFFFFVFSHIKLDSQTLPPKIPLCAALSPSSGSDPHYHHHHESCCSPDDVTLQLLDSSHLHLSSQELQSDSTAHSTSLSSPSHCAGLSAMKLFIFLFF